MIRRDSSAFPFGPTASRRPRRHAPAHLAFIRSLPCCLSDKGGCQHAVEAAHVRYRSLRAGKRETGKAEKPSDCWVVPLCAKHHREQHDAGGEQLWWGNRDPLILCAFLYLHSGDAEAAKMVIRSGIWRPAEVAGR